MTHENKTDAPETLYLKEALRAAEWQIEQQNKAFDSIERKAIQLITLYVVTIAFIIPFIISFIISPDMLNENFEELIKILLFLLIALAMVALIGAVTLDPRPSERGNNNSMRFLLGLYKNDFNTMMQILLNDHVKRYDINVKVLRKKTRYFEILLTGGAIICFVWGILFYNLWQTWISCPYLFDSSQFYCK